MVARVGQSSRQAQANRGCVAWMRMENPPEKDWLEATSARTPPGKSVAGEKSCKRPDADVPTSKKPGGVGGSPFRTTAAAREKPGHANSASGLLSLWTLASRRP